MAKKPAEKKTEEVTEEKPEEKPKEKPAPKKEPKPKAAKKEKKPKAAKATSGLQSVEDSLAKMGYMDIYDVITLGVGIWGIIWSIIGFVWTLSVNANLFSSLTGQALSDATNNAWAALGMFIVQLYIYISLALFPFFVNGGMKIINKWPDSFPLHFIKNKEDFRAFIVFLGWWCTLIFWVASSSGARWPHAISFFLLVIVIFADAFRKKISKLPEKKIRD